MPQTRDDEFFKTVGMAALCNPPTLVNTRDLCERAINEGVPGHFIECGVFAGANSAVMARVAARDQKDVRLVYLYDSFEGIPHAGPKDDESITGCIGPNKDGALVSSGVSVCSQEQVEKFMEAWGVDKSLLRYRKGWFQDTVRGWGRTMLTSGSRIAVLRLDGDLYESTAVCLKYLYPLVSKGGFVIIDDYALTGCRAAVDEYLPGVVLTPVEGGGGPAWFQKQGEYHLGKVE